MIQLGDEVQDVVTKFKGIAVARTEWLHGCKRIIIQPPINEKGEIPENGAFDEPQCIVIYTASQIKVGRSGGDTGGPMPSQQQKGSVG